METHTPPPAADARAATPRDTRVRLNRMERWLREHAPTLTRAGHGPALVRLHGLFELAFKAEHADYLAGELRDLQSTARADAGPPRLHA